MTCPDFFPFHNLLRYPVERGILIDVEKNECSEERLSVGIVWAIMEHHVDFAYPGKNGPGIGGAASKGGKDVQVKWGLFQNFT